MDKKMVAQRWHRPVAAGVLTLLILIPAAAQSPPQSAPQNRTQPPALRVTLDQAIALAQQHNHALQAARTLIQQSQADEITANLRPNPVISGDAIYLPVFNFGDFTHDYLNNVAQFDVGLGYLFERGKKRQHRLQAARDVTAVTTAQVADNERILTFTVASEFIAALLAQSNLDFAEQTLSSFQQTVDVSEAQYQAGSISEGDLLKIRLQLLQFQTDVSAARLARVQALATLRRAYILDFTRYFRYSFFVLDFLSISVKWRLMILWPFFVKRCSIASSVVMSFGCFFGFLGAI
jgi:outer membrane protein, heavy metal efflux system